MKKLFVLFSLVVFAGLTSKAQFGHAASFAGTTLTNTDTSNHIITATAGYNSLGIQVLVNKTSGTLAGKVIIYQSLDGVNFQGTDTATVFNATPTWAGGPTATYSNSVYFNKQTVPGVYYMVSIITSGTVSATEKTLYTLRKNISQ